MSTLVSSLIVMTLLALNAVPFVNSCNRYRYYGEPCLGNLGYGGTDQCDPYRMLKCDPRTGTCQCPDFYYYFFDNYNSRCYHKIGTACEEKFGGLSESRYDHGCPENSFCNPGSGYCQCKPLYRQNYDGTGCFNGARHCAVFGVLGILPFLVLTSSLHI